MTRAKSQFLTASLGLVLALGPAVTAQEERPAHVADMAGMSQLQQAQLQQQLSKRLVVRPDGAVRRFCFGL